MRYLSAHYVFPVSSPPLKMGIVCVDDRGIIVDLIDTAGKLEERANLEFYNGILVPGFVNAHCHLELSHMRGVMNQHSGLPDFLSSIGGMRPTAKNEIYQAAVAAENEMLREGIVAVGDISNTTDTLELKRNNRLRYHTFVEVSGLANSCAEMILDQAWQLERRYREIGSKASIVPHAMYSVSDALFGLLASHYAQHPSIVSMHHQESREETDLYPQGKGQLIDAFRQRGLLPEEWNACDHLVEQMEQCLSHAMQCLLVHNTFVSADDFQQRTNRLKRLFWVLCPRSNLFIQHCMPDLSIFANHVQHVCLGTDSLASNTTLSILEEMKTIHQHAPDLPLSQLLQWATLNGAQALGFDNMLGSMEQHKRPGINLITGIDFEQLHLTANSRVKVLVPA